MPSRALLKKDPKRHRCQAPVPGTYAEEFHETKPLCPVFGSCGGCAYQDLPYEEELRLKESHLTQLFAKDLGLYKSIFEPIVASPKAYHYRSRLDLTFLKTRKGEIAMGFMPEKRKRIVTVEACPIADEKISNFLPELKKQATQKMPPDYRLANLVVKTGDEGKIAWGGIGRRSLVLGEKDYFFTEVLGKRIFYSLDTFFQANLSILPELIRTLERLASLDSKTTFLDLYSGVGLFGISFAERVQRVIMIEESPASAQLARFNVHYHGLEAKIESLKGKVEDKLPDFPACGTIELGRSSKWIALVDPPRKGLSREAIDALIKVGLPLHQLFYLSCSPESLVRDLKKFLKAGWKVEKVIPFDFFPKTRHLETLVWLKP